MDFDQRLEYGAMHSSPKREFGRSNYAPPIYHCLWFAGVRSAAAAFCLVRVQRTFSGAWFGTAGRTLCGSSVWSHTGLPGLQAVAFAVSCRRNLRTAMATYYAISARHYGLPHWSTIADPAAK